MDAEKFQNLQKAQEEVKKARDFLDVMETKAMKDLAKAFALKSGDKDNKDFVVLETQDEDLKLMEKLLDKKLVKAKDLDSQEANLSIAAIQDKKSEQKAEIKALHGKLMEKMSSIIGDADLKSQDTVLAKEMYKIKTLQGKSTKKLRRQVKDKASISEQERNDKKKQIFLAIFLVLIGVLVGLLLDGNRRSLESKQIEALLVEKTTLEANLYLQRQTYEMRLANSQNDFSLAKTYLKEIVNVKDNKRMIRLHIASQDGHLKEAEILLKLGADVNAKDDDDWNPLHYAAYNGHSEITKLLLQNAAEVNAKNYYQRAPLHFAVANGHFDIAKLLIQNGADIDPKDDKQRTPLHLAADYGHSKIAELLLQNGADVDAQEDGKNTPLYKAAYFGYPEVVEVLLKHGARKDLKNNDNRTPLQMAEYYKRGDYKKVIALLKQN